jgi:hypothetical protein
MEKVLDYFLSAASASFSLTVGVNAMRNAIAKFTNGTSPSSPHHADFPMRGLHKAIATANTGKPSTPASTKNVANPSRQKKTNSNRAIKSFIHA